MKSATGLGKMSKSARSRSLIHWDLLEDRRLMSATGLLAFTGDTYPAPQKPLVVTVFDSSGNVESSYNGPINLAWTGPMTGSSTVSAANGVATFSDVALVDQGNYTLTATDGQSDQPTSAVVTTQSSPSERSQIVVVQQPKLDPATGTFSVVVGVKDALGNLVPNNSSGGALPGWISIQSGPDGALIFGSRVQYGIAYAGVPISSQMPTLNPDGTMTFSGLKVSVAGSYTFQINDATPIASVLTTSITLPASALPPVMQPGLDPATPSQPPIWVVPNTVSLTKKQQIALLKQEHKQALAAAHAAKVEKIAEARQLKLQKILAFRQARLAAIKAKKAAAEAKLT